MHWSYIYVFEFLEPDLTLKKMTCWKELKNFLSKYILLFDLKQGRVVLHCTGGGGGVLDSLFRSAGSASSNI